MKDLGKMNIEELEENKKRINALLKDKGIKEKRWSVMIVDSLMVRLKKYKRIVRPRISMVQIVEDIIKEYLDNEGY